MKRAKIETRDAAHPARTGALSTRRTFIAATLGGVTSAALLGACGGQSETATPGTGGTTSSGGGAGTGGSAGTGGTGTGGSSGTGGSAGTGGNISDSGACTVYPQQTEGPFFLDGDLVRSDITEGKPGASLNLEVVVVSANDCTPIANARVDVWQCDAAGVYSGYPNQLGGFDTTGQTFLRGTQITDADGRVTFRTIYPGWYPGRTTHIHFKVHPSSTTEATSQMYFPEDVTATVYTAAPYAARGQKDTTNQADGIAQTGGFPSLLAITETDTAYNAKLTVAVVG
jgi:protocatechuate 3,4-dioxygenase beta subunit